MVCRHEISANIGDWMCHIWCRDAHDCGERRLIPLLDGDPDLDRHLAAGVVLAQMDFRPSPLDEIANYQLRVEFAYTLFRSNPNSRGMHYTVERSHSS
jgi:hypothetical protein